MKSTILSVLFLLVFLSQGRAQLVRSEAFHDKYTLAEAVVLSRLGAAPRLVTKIGQDSGGDHRADSGSVTMLDGKKCAIKAQKLALTLPTASALNLDVKKLGSMRIAIGSLGGRNVFSGSTNIFSTPCFWKPNLTHATAFLFEFMVWNVSHSNTIWISLLNIISNPILVELVHSGLTVTSTRQSNSLTFLRRLCITAFIRVNKCKIADTSCRPFCV